MYPLRCVLVSCVPAHQDDAVLYILFANVSALLHNAMWKTLVTQLEVNDRRIFWTIIVLIVCALFSYVYFLSLSVYGVIARKQAETQLTDLASKISTLESEYASLERNINLEFAYTRGFIDIAVPRYISRIPQGDTLTLRGDRDTR